MLFAQRRFVQCVFQTLSAWGIVRIGVSAIGVLADVGRLFGRCGGYFRAWRKELATPAGFEPALSTVTGCHVVFPTHRPKVPRPHGANLIVLLHFLHSKEDLPVM